MSKLSDKAGRITFDDLDAPPVRAADPARVPEPSDSASRAAPRDQPRTGVGAFSASLAMGRQIEQENDDLKRKLLEFEDAVLVEMLDPKLIKPSRFANRHERSFSSPDFESLKNEISSAGRNIQAIKVRRGPVDEGAQTYEIVFGHRRHRACLELGLPVAAVVDDLDDTQLFAEMDRENRARADLSPWEQGLMYARALDSNLFSSQRQLAESIGVSQTTVSQAIVLAKIPQEVIDAFPNPLDIQFRWGSDLKQRMDLHKDAVLSAAREITATGTQLPAKEVLYRLLGAAKTTLPAPLQIVSKGKPAGTFGHARNGDLEIRIGKGHLSASAEKSLSDFIDKLLN